MSLPSPPAYHAPYPSKCPVNELTHLGYCGLGDTVSRLGLATSNLVDVDLMVWEFQLRSLHVQVPLLMGALSAHL